MSFRVPVARFVFRCTRVSGVGQCDQLICDTTKAVPFVRHVLWVGAGGARRPAEVGEGVFSANAPVSVHLLLCLFLCIRVVGEGWGMSGTDTLWPIEAGNTAVV